MEKITLKAPAKLNLFLDIVGIREDGYHLINSVMQTIDLCDMVTVELNGSDKITIECNNDSVPLDERNIVYKIANEILKRKNIKKGIHIKIEKKIPMETGMGGGSADGAAVIIALDKLLSLNLSDEEKISIGQSVGADIPFMTFGGTAFVEGIGEKLTPITKIKNGYFVIVKPAESVSTKLAYQKIDENGLLNISDKTNILKAVENQDIKNIAKSMDNIFEKVVSNEILKIKDILIENGAISSLMTGSGSGIFGIFEEAGQAQKAYESISKLYDKVFLCKPTECGPF